MHGGDQSLTNDLGFENAFQHLEEYVGTQTMGSIKSRDVRELSATMEAMWRI